MLLGGVECDLLPAERRPIEHKKEKKKDTKAWESGQLIVRCERQGLRELPAELFRKPTLRRLLLSHNSLTAIPPDVRRLRELRVLQLGHNELEALPAEVGSLKWLEVLEVQHNNLHTVPLELAKLTHLEVLNLEGNPLQQRPAGSRANGPTVGEIWSAPCEGGKDGVGGAAQAGPAAGTGGSSHVEELKMRTQNLLSFLLELLDPQQAEAVKQAKLTLMQQAARNSIMSMLHVADLESIEACAAVAQHAGIAPAELAAVEAARAGVRALQDAIDAGDRAQLHNALRAFEALCKPACPSGPVYLAAQDMHWTLRRKEQQRGWRSPPLGMAAAASPVPEHEVDDAGSPSSSPPPQGAEALTGAAWSGSRWPSWGERRRQKLEESGALKHAEWLAQKTGREQQDKAREVALHAAEQEAKLAQRVEKATTALHYCELETHWPSRMVAPFPAGTFATDAHKRAQARKERAGKPARAAGSNAVGGQGGSGARPCGVDGDAGAAVGTAGEVEQLRAAEGPPRAELSAASSADTDELLGDRLG